ncbi:hypothetical protein BY996DRAFT_4605095 [Phakopsora pachyrhizi]|nr:hypothetical protein BY996DRAFT_4605095 [Phakopsora pachyrhizi]
MNPDSNGDDGRSEHLLREKGLSDGYRSEAIGLKGLIDELSKDLIRMERRLIESSLKLPNLTHPDVPIGPYQNSRIVSTSSVMLDGQQDESDLPFESFEEPFQKLPDPDRDHLGLMNDLNWISFPEGQRSTGPSFPVLIGGGAILELVLINYSISICLKSGYQLKILPELIRFGISERCGFNPRDQSSHQTYFVSTDIDPDHERIKAEGQKVEEEDLNRLCLSATAEIPMIGSYHSTTFPQPSSSSDSRVIKLVGLSNCFRSEAGSRGLNSRGLYRVHQFKKLELINLVKSDNIDESEERLKDLVKLQVEILRGLKLPYRVLEMSSEELGASAYHKFDIECWMPGRGKWGEVTSASNCTDYQSRRLSIKFKPTLTDEKTLKEGEPEGNPGERLKEQEGEEQEGIGSKRNSNDNDRKKLKFVQTLNATAAAIPRLMISLIENGVILDDKRLKRSRRVVGIRLPIVLKPFWNQLECDREVNNGFIRWY